MICYPEVDLLSTVLVRGRSALKSHLVRLAGLASVVMLVASCSSTPEEARDAFMAKGDDAFARKKYFEATIEYRKALQQDLRYSLGYNKLGDAYSALNDPRNALSSYVRASDLDPGDIPVNLKAGNLLLV